MPAPPTAQNATASLVIPAHNEQKAIARLLAELLSASDIGEFEIIVVCNGCSDQTAQIARTFSGVVVVELDKPSKSEALKRGDDAATSYPRIYIDADVEIGGADIRELLRALETTGALAAGPARLLPKNQVALLVRAYYNVWEQLPQVRTGLFGRGVIALSAAGHARVERLPSMMSDDLAISEAFSEAERVVVPEARVIVRPPRTVRDLIRRRTRVHTGNAQFDQTTGRRAESKTGVRDLIGLVRDQPRLAPSAIVFLAVAVWARLASRRQIRAGDFKTWLRDESSRAD